MSWQEICAKGTLVYNNPGQIPDGSKDAEISAYAMDVMNNSRRFVSAIVKPGMRVLDLGGSKEPWFAYLSADADAKVTVYDILYPAQPGMLKEKGIDYVRGNVAELHDLGKFDLVFSRGLYPAQLLRDWYDKDFLKFWDVLLGMGKSIYWVQMGDGRGVPSTKGVPFANHRREYFEQFFQKLNASATVRQYGFMSFEIGSPVLPDPANAPKRDLRDWHELCKWYAYQLQNAGEQKNARANHKLIKTLLRNNFRQGHDGHGTAELSNDGPGHDDYFLVSEKDDRRFSIQFVRLARWSLLYKLARSAALRLKRS